VLISSRALHDAFDRLVVVVMFIFCLFLVALLLSFDAGGPNSSRGPQAPWEQMDRNRKIGHRKVKSRKI
jgi:hypothetical protein